MLLRRGHCRGLCGFRDAGWGRGAATTTSVHRPSSVIFLGPSLPKEDRAINRKNAGVADPLTFQLPYHTCHLHTVASSSTMSLWDSKETKKRKVVPSAVTDQDRETLRRHYTFLPDAASPRSRWPQRMVAHYHEHLYKDFVLANMTRVQKQQLGLRWRTAAEVQAGRGSETCGNLDCPHGVGPTRASDYYYRDSHHYYCPTTEQEEKARVEKLPHGTLLADFEVPFTYKEQGLRKTELVRLRLCVRCAPLLFQSKGDKHPYLAACRARMTHQLEEKVNDDAPEEEHVEASSRHAKRNKGSEKEKKAKTK